MTEPIRRFANIIDNPVFNDDVESKLKAALDDFKANNTW